MVSTEVLAENLPWPRARNDLMTGVRFGCSRAARTSLSSRVSKYVTHFRYKGSFSWQKLRHHSSHLSPRSCGVLHHQLGFEMKSLLKLR